MPLDLPSTGCGLALPFSFLVGFTVSFADKPQVPAIRDRR